jgi:multiple sugar transport system permease protein
VSRPGARLPLGVWVAHAALAAGAALVVGPFLWIALAAFKTPIALLSGAVVFTPVLRNFREVLLSKTSEYLLNFGNSLVVGLASTALVLVIATLGAYSLARLRWPRWVVHGLLGWAAVFHMVPPITMVATWYVMFRTAGLDNTRLGLVLAHVTLNLPFALWLMAAFIREVPRELEDAARIDGATTLGVLWRVIVPLTAPGLAATGLLAFVFSWNEFAVALNLTARQTATVPVGIAKFAQDFEIQYVQMAAASLLSALPALVLLLVGQRYIVKGLTAGALR